MSDSGINQLMKSPELRERIVTLRTKGYTYKEIIKKLKPHYGDSLNVTHISKIYNEGMSDLAVILGVSTRMNAELLGSMHRATEYTEKASRIIWDKVNEIKDDPEIDAKNVAYLLKELREQQKTNMQVREKMSDGEYKDAMKLVELTRRVMQTVKMMAEQGIIKILDKDTETKIATMLRSTR